MATIQVLQGIHSRYEKKKQDHGVLTLPNDTITFSELEKLKTKMF